MTALFMCTMSIINDYRNTTHVGSTTASTFNRLQRIHTLK